MRSFAPRVRVKHRHTRRLPCPARPARLRHVRRPPVTSRYVGGRGDIHATARLNQLARQHLEAAEDSFAQVRHRLALAHPRRRLQEWAQRLDDANLALAREAKTHLRERRHRFGQAALHLLRLKPTSQLALRREQVTALTTRLRLLSPGNVLARGYSITTDAATGKVIRRAEQAKPGQTLHTRVQHGEIESVVLKPAQETK